MSELFSEFSGSLTNNYETKVAFSLRERVLHEHFLVFLSTNIYVCLYHPWCVLVGVPETEERGAYHFKCA